MTPTPRFIVDAMVGKLARWLRILGYDTVYFRCIEDAELLEKARAEGRWLITRDRHLIPRYHDKKLTFIQDDHPKQQLRQIVAELRLDPYRNVLTRCLECNERLVTITKDTVQSFVPPYVFRTQEQFSRCPQCRRIYWKGTHHERMKRRLTEMFPTPSPFRSNPYQGKP